MTRLGSMRAGVRALAHLTVAALLWAVLLPVPAQQGATGAAPGSGFADPHAAPRRPPTPDIEPVYRGPSIDTLATIRMRGVLRVGVAVSEPMVMHDTKGQLVGFSIDLAHRLAEDLGVQLELVETSWSRVIPDLLERRFDLIAAGLWVTAPRALVISYTEPTAVEGIYLVANKSMLQARKTIEDFNKPGVNIVVYAGTAQEHVAGRLLPKANLVKVEGDADHLVPVIEGKAHAALVPALSAQVLLRQAPDKLTLPLDKPLSSVSAALGVRKGDPDFVIFLNTWLSLQRDEGWLHERALHWSTSTEWLK
jgi:polar amino acid transport system substrate-binding protein